MKLSDELAEAIDRGISKTFANGKGYIDLGKLDHSAKPDQWGGTGTPVASHLGIAIEAAYLSTPVIYVRDPSETLTDAEVKKAIAFAFAKMTTGKKTAESKAIERYRQTAKVKIDRFKGKDGSPGVKITFPETWPEMMKKVSADAQRARDFIRKRDGAVGFDKPDPFYPIHTQGWSDDDYADAAKVMHTLSPDVRKEVKLALKAKR